jgi:hypothetical protein
MPADSFQMKQLAGFGYGERARAVGAAQGGGFLEQFTGGRDGGRGGGRGRRCDGVIVGIAKAARAKETEAIKNQIANFRGVFDAVELGGVQGIVILFIGLATAAAGGLDVDVGQAEDALEGALGDGDLLKIGEAHREFLHLPNAAAEAEAAIGDDVPALFVVEADGRVGDESHEEEARECDDFEHHDDAEHPPRHAFGRVAHGEIV